jgi:hypothetical protein
MENKICAKCGRKMSMYYKPICFYCTKPDGINVKVYELIPVFKHLDTIRSGFYERMMDFYKNMYKFDNDSYHYLMIDTILEEPEEYYTNEYIIKDIEFLIKEYPDANDSLWNVSW